ncbi:MAG TPA: metallophosphoesterase family protein [Tepidisphaeraceae bacterium]|nr:metallophosphoesterase family protein [Tepidisphaeraceae bacterium]
MLPYLQNPASDAMTIRWFSESADAGTVALAGGPTTIASSPALASALSYHSAEVGWPHPARPYAHSVRLTNLAPGTSYEYTVLQNGTPFTSTFRTAPAKTDSIRFAVYADSETEPESTGKRAAWTAPIGANRPAGLNDQYVVDQTEGYRQNLAAIAARNPDFVAIAGDLVESGGEQRDWDEFWKHNAGAYGTLASRTPIIAALGNHENYGGPGDLGGYTAVAANRSTDKFRTYFETPDNGATNAQHNGRYHRFDLGPITYITIDSSDGGEHGKATDTNHHLSGSNAPDYMPGSEQYAWLQSQLADAQQASQFTFVQFHHAPYSTGPHGLAPGAIDAGLDPQSGVPMRALTPLLSQYGVDAVFSGHDEMYEHSLVDGIHFYDVGIGGDGLRAPLTEDVLKNEFQEFIAHTDAPEIWDGNVLLSGGKHYGHVEVNVFEEDGIWKAILTPVYLFPLMNTKGEVTGWERREHTTDIVTLTAVPEPASAVGVGLGGMLLLGTRRRRYS